MSHATHPVAGTALAVLLVQAVMHLSSTLSPTHARVVINEIVYRPGSGEPEWVELFNAADTAVSIAGWVLHDRTSARPVIADGVIPSRGFVVITRDTAALRSLRGPAGTLVSLSLPSLNNSGDDVVLLDAEGRTVDSVPYSSSWGGATGLSLERIDYRGSSLVDENWGSCVDSSGATPGAKNSLAPVGRDLGIMEGGFDYERTILSIPIRNLGTDRSVGATLVLHHDANRNGDGAVHEIISSRSIGPIDPRDSVIVELPWPRSLTVEGEVALLLLDHPEDEAPENDRLALLLRQRLGDSGLVVNEIMYDPIDDEPEWVELTNRGANPVDIDGWILHDAGKSRPVLPVSTIAPGGFLVLTSDSALLRSVRPTIPSPIVEAALPSFNNGGDRVQLLRPDGSTADSLQYGSSWGGADGTSLERLTPEHPSTESSSWGTSRAEMGATPGEPNSLLPPESNLALRSATFFPGVSVLQIEVVSTGRRVPETAEIIAGVDADRNLVIEQAEIVAGREISRIDTLIDLTWPRPVTLSGEVVTLVVRSTGDERPEDDTLRITLRAPSPDSGIVISEIEFDPPEGLPEWIEIFNLTEEAIDLEEWRVGDAVGVGDAILDAGIAGYSYLVITSDSSALHSAIPGIPSPIIETTLPSFNNGGDVVTLLNRDGIAVDSLRYGGDWRSADEGSLERKRIDRASTDRENWTGSTDPLGRTPGRANSWRPVRIDLFIEGLAVDHVDGSTVITGEIRNRGEIDPGEVMPDSARLRYGVDLNLSGEIDPGEESGTLPVPFPTPTSLTLFSIPWNRPLSIDGEWGIVVVEIDGEENEKDNRRSILIRRPRIDSGLVVNEIMYDPRDDEPEWVEIANRSGDTIDLGGWILRDAGAARPSLPSRRLPPGRFVVVTSDSAALESARPVFSTIVEADLPTLNNGGDLVALHAPDGRLVDSVPYRPEWGGSDGRSLERIGPFAPSDDPGSWGSSIDGGGGTPGWANSIIPAERDLRLESVSFDPEKSEVRMMIRNIGTDVISQGEVRLYVDTDEDGAPDEGELERTEVIASIGPDESREVIASWQRPLRPEGEEALAEVYAAGEDRIDDNLLPFHPRSRLGSTGAIINEFQAAPVGSEPEWIEILNPTELPIDLDRWEVADGASSVIVKGEALLPEGGYAVVTTDTALLRSAYDLPKDLLLIEARLPSLNNAGDIITLRNAGGERIDSLAYDNSWPTRGTGSTERKHPALNSTDPAGWTTSEGPQGGTPGRSNSTLLPDRNLAIDSIRFDPVRSWLTTHLRNAGAYQVDGGEMTVLVQGKPIDRLPLGPLAFNESIILDYPIELELTDDPLPVGVQLDVPVDEIPDDDTLSLLLQRPPAETGLIITELMVDPMPKAEGIGAEYVEVYNAGARPVSLVGWSIEEGSGKRSEVREGETGEAHILHPGTFGLLASDSSLFDRFPETDGSPGTIVLGEDLGLNNGGDRVLLLNPSGVIIDSLTYDVEWHDPELIDTRGVSLERIAFDRPPSDPTSWASSVDPRGGTPGAENSRRLAPVRGKTLLELSGETISPDDDGYEDFLRITWNLPFTPATVRISILDRGGHPILHPADGIRSGPEGEVVWDGRDADGRTLGIGPVVIRLEAVDTATGVRMVERRIVVVAGRL